MSEPRIVTADDLDSLDELLNGIFRCEKNIFDQNVLTDFPLVFVPENFGNCRVVEVDQQIVSHAAIFRCEMIIKDVVLKTAVIILVATDPRHRKQGHAARLMQDLQRTMHEESYDLGVLWTGVPDFYRKLGWEVVTPRGWMIQDLRSNADLANRLAPPTEPTAKIARYDSARHQAGIQELHDREPIRTRRSAEEYGALLSLPKMTVWVLERADEVAAYAVVGQAVNKFGVIEYGGAADNVLTLVAHALENQDLTRELPLLMYHTQRDLAQHVLAAGVPLEPLECSKGPGIEMLYRVNPDRLSLDALTDLFCWGLDFT